MGIPVARIGDIGVGKDVCHTSTKDASGVIINGAGTVRAEGIPVAQLGSIFHGCFRGIIVTGAGTVRAS